MIVYVPDPLELWQQSECNYITVNLASGGYLVAEPFEYNKIKVISISSTNPMDYLNSKLQPGSIISLEAKID